MKEKIEKPKRAKDVTELFHHFAHEVFEKEQRSGYSYENDVLEFNGEGHGWNYGSWDYNVVICKIIDREKKIAVINNKFDRTGAFGSGNNWINVKRAFGDDWKILFYNNLRIDFNIIDAIVYTVRYNSFDRTIEDYIRLKYLASTPSVYSMWTSVNRLQEEIQKVLDEIDKLCNDFGADKNVILDTIIHERISTVVKYNGWSSYGQVSESIMLDKPIKWYLDIANLFSLEDMKTIDFKNWKQQMISIHKDATFNYKLFGKTYEAIYNSPRKDEFQAYVEKKKLEWEAWQEIKRKRIQEASLVKQQETLKKWLSGEAQYRWYLYDIPTHLRIGKEGNVETSMGASVPLEHARLLYKKFRNCIQLDTEWVTNGSSIKVGVYQVQHIKKDSEGCWHLKAGCHIIYEREIELFVESNSLQQWRE